MNFGSKWQAEREQSLLPEGSHPVTQRQFFYQQYWHMIREVAERVSKEAQILEIGCGRGTISQYLERAGYSNLTLLDNSEEALELARQNVGEQATFVNGDALELPFGDGTFDLTFSLGVSEHLDDFRVFFDEQLRVLRPGGYLLCMTVPRKPSVQILNVFGSDRYYRSSTTVDEYKRYLEEKAGKPVEEWWANPYPLFTPIPRWLDEGITTIYRGMDRARGLLLTRPFSGPRLVCQSHFLVARKVA